MYRKPVLLLVFIVSLILIAPVVKPARIHQYNLDLENFRLGVRVYGNITNNGDKPVDLGKTDVYIFDYPLETGDQNVTGVKAYFNGSIVPYEVEIKSDHSYLIIKPPKNFSYLDPGETLSVGVEYNVSINWKNRVYSVIEFSTNNTEKLIDKAGTWKDIPVDIVNEYTNKTILWNYSNPLVKLFVKYLKDTVNTDKPLTLVLGVLGWFDENIIYSTRIPARHPWEVLVEGAGDCDDQSNLLITVLRAFKLPSYLEIGFVYIAKTFHISGSEAGGHYNYEFIGGGSHGWVSAYIPPWGWLRIDLTASLGKGINHIRNAAYYVFPTIVMGKIRYGDYAENTAKYVENLEKERIVLKIVLKMINYEVGGS